MLEVMLEIVTPGPTNRRINVSKGKVVGFTGAVMICAIDSP
jgi:hypothetical protein